MYVNFYHKIHHVYKIKNCSFNTSYQNPSVFIAALKASYKYLITISCFYEIKTLVLSWITKLKQFCCHKVFIRWPCRFSPTFQRKNNNITFRNKSRWLLHFVRIFQEAKQYFSIISYFLRYRSWHLPIRFGSLGQFQLGFVKFCRFANFRFLLFVFRVISKL